MDWAVRGVGVLYGVAGLLALRHVLIKWRLERTVAELRPASPTERAADVMLAMGAVLVTASGVALMLLQPWAVVAFLACWAVQAVYLLWAQRWHRPRCPISRHGRRETLHAFAVYSLVTLGVLFLPMAGILD